jgi:preprotein translocase subunit YajC
METFVVIIVIVGLAWAVFALPARRRQRSHQAMQDSVEVGDEIITAGGMHAHVRGADEGELQVEIAPGVVVTLDRRAVAAVARDEEVEPDSAAEGEPVADAEAGALTDPGGDENASYP